MLLRLAQRRQQRPHTGQEERRGQPPIKRAPLVVSEGMNVGKSLLVVHSTLFKTPNNARSALFARQICHRAQRRTGVLHSPIAITVLKATVPARAKRPL